MVLDDSQTACLENLKKLNDEGNLEGLFKDIPIEVYHHPECPGFSKSDLVYAAKTYDHLLAYKADRAMKGNSPEMEEDETPIHFKIGNAVECALFDPKAFADKYIPMVSGEPQVDKRTKDGKLTWAQWHKEVFIPWNQARGNRMVLSAEEMDLVLTMCNRGSSHDLLKRLVVDGMFQATIFFRSKQGILLKTRPDMVNEKFGICYDHKTTRDATRAQFSRQIANLKYHVQGAMQIDGLKSVYGKTFDFLLGAHEKPLGGLQIFSMDEYNLDVGRALYNRTLDYLEEVQKGKAPKGFPVDIVPIGLPAYAFDIESQ